MAAHLVGVRTHNPCGKAQPSHTQRDATKLARARSARNEIACRLVRSRKAHQVINVILWILIGALAGITAHCTPQDSAGNRRLPVGRLRPGQIRGEPWLSRALVKLNELDQYDDAELVRKKTAAMFAGFVTRANPEDNLMGEGNADAEGIALAGLEPGTLQILEPGEDIKFSDPADVGGSYSEFLRTQFRAVAAAIGITYEQLTGDLTGVNYSSIRAGMLEFRRRCEMVQHGVLVHQLCRPVWAAWMKQAVLAGALDAPGFARGGAARRRQYLAVKWIPQGWQWVDPEKEFKAMLLAIRSGLMSRSEAISAFGYDAEDVDREIAADNQRADDLGLIFDSDPRRTSKDGGSAEPTQIELDHNALIHALRNEAFHASILTMNLGGAAQRVLLRDVQMHPYRAQVLHVDFQRIDENKKIHMKVPLHFVNAELSPAAVSYTHLTLPTNREV